MQKIDKHIADLLHNHNCVVIPDFGGFIANIKPAFFDKKINTFYPASKNILFNPNIKNNDGLLANEIVKQQNISFEQANQLLIEYKDYCYVQLTKDSRIEIERVGVLFFDEEKNIQFQQSKHNFLTSSFGFSPLTLKPVEAVKPTVKQVDDTKQVVTMPVENRKSIPPKKEVVKEKKRKRAWVYVAPVILGLAVGGIFFLNRSRVISNSNNLQLSKLDFFSSETRKYKKVPIKSDFKKEEEAKDVAILTEAIELPAKVEVENSTRNVNVNNSIELKNNTEKPYHIIGGCFSVKENAEKLVMEWQQKGNLAEIVDVNNGFHRVSIAAFETIEQATEYKATLKSNGISCWILEK